MANGEEMGNLEMVVEVEPRVDNELSGKNASALPSMDAQRMFENIALSNAHIKSQQRDEGDPSTNERIQILTALFHHNPAVFLEKYHPYLCEDDLPCFDDITGDYEVMFYLEKAKKRLGRAGRKTSVLVKNRRYEALKKLEKEGTYFSDNEMRARDPLMYEQLIGQYLTDEEFAETREKIDPTDLKFSTILMSFMQDQKTKALLKSQQDHEDDAVEEEEEEEEDEEEDAGDNHSKHSCLKVKHHGHKQHSHDDDDDDDEEEMDEDDTSADAKRQPTPATEAEKRLLREEFQSVMRQRFLSGEDKDFDYSAVDNNAEFDSLVIRAWDEEEKYFDDEDPCVLGGALGSENDCKNGKTGSEPVSRTGGPEEEVDDYETWMPDETQME